MEETMLSRLFNSSLVLTQAAAENWEQAARLSGGLLVAAGAAEPRYVDAMLETVRAEGAYIVLTKGFALFHARPECGVLRECAALVTLRQAVEFGAGEKDPVDVVIAYAGAENDGHVLFIQKLALLLLQPNFLDSLRSCSSPEEVQEVLQRFENTH